MSRNMASALVIATGFLLASCTAPGVIVGGANNGPVSGSAGSNGSKGTVQLTRCKTPRATILLNLSNGSDQRKILIANSLPPNPLPAMRLIAQQSGCFRIVLRNKAIERERALQRSGETRTTRFSKGKMVAADYTLLVEVILSNPNKSGSGGFAGIGSLLGPIGLIAGAVAGGIHTSEAGVVLTLINNSTSIQTAVASGSASGSSFALGGMLGIGGGGFAALGGAGGYENTDQGKVVMGAMIDAMNKLIPNVPNDNDIPKLPKHNDKESVLVHNIQIELKKHGYKVNADGRYGAKTKSAIVIYQKKHNLLVDGRVSRSLLEYIKNRP